MRDVARRIVKILAAVALLVTVVAVARRLLAPEPEPSDPDWPPLDPAPRPTAKPADSVAGAPDRPDTAEAAPWVAPTGEGCPASHPIKAKDRSKIFHVPGGGNYDRTQPDRCYLDAAAAAADGYRQSKV